MAVILSGCATIISGTTDKATINSAPIGATFIMKDQNGKPVNNGTTPMTVLLERGEFIFDGQTYTIDFSAPGYLSQTYILDSTLNPWYLGNILFGGALGMLIIDPATGAMWDFPSDVNVTLTKAE